MHATLEEAKNNAALRAHASGETRYVVYDYQAPRSRQYIVVNESSAREWGWRFVESVVLPNGAAFGTNVLASK